MPNIFSNNVTVFQRYKENDTLLAIDITSPTELRHLCGKLERIREEAVIDYLNVLQRVEGPIIAKETDSCGPDSSRLKKSDSLPAKRTI